ncbi:MAG TPA: ribonuclease III domain-containing protein [Candidatus Omnitrophota bacterium]|nr:ribonuclease III domain-containing protein [Candidatus Omnitrophota bacterium]
MAKRSTSKDPHTKISLRKVLKIPLHNLSWYRAALSHPSFRNENFSKTKELEDFDRLEFLGDSILNEVICQKLFVVFPEADEGMLSKLRSILVSQRILSRIAKTLKLRKILLLGRHLQHNFNGQLEIKILTDALEALFAAIYFDHGHEKIEAFILKHFKGYFDPKLLFRLDPNPKSTLQEMTLKKWKKLPEYRHSYSPKGVKTIASIGRKRKAVGWDKIKRESELKAARALIQLLRKEFKKK